eukprot:GHVN01065254.1.p1 GENE.GHVN01065254.1~~GHVN01065254.1.p1  ORF type:complete len:214 (+),score=35.55 GHVN01065254.1:508-1149(+)
MNWFHRINAQGNDTFIRPIYAGNAITKVSSTDKTKILMIRPTAFDPVASKGSNKAPIVKVEDMTLTNKGQKWVSDEFNVSEKPQLSSSGVVVSGGRALQSAEAFDTVLGPLCDALNAALGATRAAVDANMVPSETQVGQTGQVVAPQLYIAVGISGAIQHVAGMKDSKTVVAINKDAEAPIFKVSDYGLVGDLFTLVPELTKVIKERKLKVVK